MTPFYVDNTMLKTTQCSLQAWLRHVKKRTTTVERAELLVGQAIHQALEHHFKGESPDACMAVFLERYERWSRINTDPEDRLDVGNVGQIFRYWLETRPLGQIPFTPIPEMIEVSFEAPLDEHGEIIFCGNIDLGAIDHAGPVIVEHKTTGRVSNEWTNKWMLDSQLSGYLFGVREGINPKTGKPLRELFKSYAGQDAYGAIINVIELPKLIQDDGKKCYKHHLPKRDCRLAHPQHGFKGPFIRSEAALLAWRANALNLARMLQRLSAIEDIKLVSQEGMFYNTCQFCEFSELCIAPLDQRLIEGRLLAAAWNPRTRQVEEIGKTYG